MAVHRDPSGDPGEQWVEARPGEIRTATPGETAGGSATTRRADGRAEGAGITGGLILLLIIGFALVVLVAQNTEEVRFEFLGWDAEVPLVVLLLAVAFATLLLDQIVGWIWRRRRRRVRALTRH
jgi:uncharacterized integral membrane protein